MELHLVKYRRQGDVTEHLAEAELTPFRHDQRPAPEQRYTVRRFRPDDAVGIAQCVYRSFGYSYGDTDLYYPARLVHLNETGQLVSIVAVDEAGGVVGHLGLERPDLGPVAESSDAVVAPAHRHRHLLERLRGFAEEEGSRLGLQGIVAYPVTAHPFSQRMEETIGGKLCAVALGQLPRTTTFTGIATTPTGQRVSTMLYFKHLVAPSGAVVHAPPRHASMLERLYGNLGVAATLRPRVVATGTGRVNVSLDRAWGYGEIHVETIGADTAAEVRRARRDLCTVADAEVVYLYLPLAQAGAPEVCERAEDDGFFFSGLAPRFAPDGDALCLQYVCGELDPALLQVESPLGHELVTYVTAERARVHG
jgi:serine/threonine-protein kinase RsbW